MGSRIQEYKSEQGQERVKEELKTPKKRTPGLHAAEVSALPDNVAAIPINDIVIQFDIKSAALHTAVEFDTLIQEYRGRALTLEDMRSFAQRVTGVLAAEGFRAYIPEQSFDERRLYVNVVSDHAKA